MAVQKRASLHEKAVQAIAKGSVQPTPRRPRKAPQRVVQPTYNSPVIPEMLWKAAKKILDDPTNGYTRWEIPDENTVIVR